MSKFKEIINRVAVLLGGDIEKFINVQGQDGTIYFIPGEVFEPGAEIYITQEDGTNIPVEDGEYTIEESVIIVKDGLIESVNGIETKEEVLEKKDEEKEKEKEEEKEEEKKEDMEANDLAERVAVLEKIVAELMNALEEQNTTQELSLARIEKIEKSPAVNSQTESEMFKAVDNPKLKWTTIVSKQRK